jgi:predicted signal transduction protein with EAL and GGDEF domain
MMLLEIVVQDIQLAVMFVFFIAIAWLLAEFKGMKDAIKERLGINNDVLKLRLQAYERLTLFAERSSLKNLVNRTAYGQLTVLDFQLDLLSTIRSEYEHNISQQIYISTDMWKAINNLKDQNTYIINQVAAMLPPQASGVELAKR